MISGLRTVLCVASVLLFYGAHAALPFRGNIHAKGAVLINAETGAVLYESNAHLPLHPSSTTKVFTALYALERKGECLDEMICASTDATLYVTPQIRRAVDGRHPHYRLEFGGTHMRLKAGEILPLRILLYGLMLSSGNDAANVIGEYVSGSVPRFLEELNRFAASKGCLNTRLYNPHGLHSPEHKTTAYDLAIASMHAMQYPFFREVVKSVNYERPLSNKQAEVVLPQHNHLVRPGKFYYPKATGVKTGYTASGGYSLVASAENEERSLIAVLLSCEKLEDRYGDAIALFEAAFNEKKVSRTLFAKGFDVFTCAVAGGKGPLQAYLLSDVAISFFPSEEPTLKSVIEWDALTLPVSAGARVGQVLMRSQEGRLLASADLYAIRAVEPTFYFRVQTQMQAVRKGVREHVTLVLISLAALIFLATFFRYHRPLR
ncbi:MAG: D-alanyl-D-alanine carboxypeptidase family protein [Chlamydiota bacterium]